MKTLSSLSKPVMSLVLAAVFCVGMQPFVPAAFGCDGTNAGGGNCRGASQQTVALDDWTVARMVAHGLGLFLGL